MGCSHSQEAPAWAHVQPQLWTGPQHRGGGRVGVLDAAIITLMITMMRHLSCRQTVNVLDTSHLCQAVLGSGVGTHT